MSGKANLHEVKEYCETVGDNLSFEGVPTLWHNTKLWGHRMHSMCSYFAMFPPAVANVMIQWLTEEGDVVYDPFCGRGTVALETRRLGRVAAAADLNPLAVVLTKAKVAKVSTDSAERRIDDLRNAFTSERLSLTGVPSDIRMLFSNKTLRQILFLRRHLNIRRSVDAFIMGTLLGIAHLNADSTGRPRGLSVSMPNTFAMAPRYINRYIEEHNLQPPDVDVFAALNKRVKVLDPNSLVGKSGFVWTRDATRQSPAALDGRVRLLFASPPYLNVIKYGKFNWVRLWILDKSPKDVDSTLMTSGSLEKYVRFFTMTLRAQERAMRSDGLACFVIGDVSRKKGTLRLAEVIAEEVERNTSWTVAAIIADELPQDRKVSRIWGTRRGSATKTDRLLVLVPPNGTAKLPAIPQIEWTV